jgi:hypothetical protein
MTHRQCSKYLFVFLFEKSCVLFLLDLSNAQVSILVGAKWNEMSDDEKRPYIEGAQKMREVQKLTKSSLCFIVIC